MSLQPPGAAAISSGKVEAWLAALTTAAAEQPNLLPKKECAICITVGEPPNARAWAILVSPANVSATSPVVVTALRESDKPGSYDCSLQYTTEDVWLAMNTGTLDGRTAVKNKQIKMSGGFRAVMGMRGLFKAASEAANLIGGGFTVRVSQRAEVRCIHLHLLYSNTS